MASKQSFTDLFNGYFDNPSSQYVQATMSPCSGGNSSSDISFDFTNKGGAISNNKSILSQFDLSDIHISVKQWTTNYKILAPKSIEYLQGIEYGASYQTEYYCIPYEISNGNNYIYFTNLKFTLNYTQNFKGVSIDFVTDASYNSKIDFISDINRQLNDMNIPIEFSIEPDEDECSDQIKVMSTQLGFKFTIADNNLNLEIIDNDIDPNSPFIEPFSYNLDKSCYHVDAIKYPNGAFRGILLKVTYPVYNASSISSYQRSLKINHIKDKVSIFKPICECSSLNSCNCSGDNLYERINFDIVGSYINPEEINNIGWIEGGIYFSNSVMNWSSSNIGSNNNSGGWEAAIGANAYKSGWEPGYAGYENQLGLYGYLEWVESNNMWTNIGPFYSIITSADNPDDNIRNFANSLIVFNPNDFPVKIDYLMFV